MTSVVISFTAFVYAILRHDVRAVLSVANAANASISLSSISDNPEQMRYCDAETHEGIFYPKTRACTEARVPCPDHIVGTIIRYCACETTRWETPNTTNCTHEWVFESMSAIKKGYPAEQISKKMAYDLEYTLSRRLYAGDITKSVTLSSVLLGLARSQFDAVEDVYDQEARATNFTESFGLYGNHLLSQQALLVWKELTPTLCSYYALLLMFLLKQSAILLGNYMLDQQKKLLYDNWAMEIDVLQWVETSRKDFSNLAAVTSLSPSVNEEMNALPLTLGDQSKHLSDNASTTATPSIAPVQFNGFFKSPIIKLPSLDILESSLNETSSAPSSAGILQQGSQLNAASSYTRLRLGYLAIANLGQLLYHGNFVMNSHIVCVYVDDDNKSINYLDDHPTTLTFFHLKENGVFAPYCVSGNFDTRMWSSKVCRLISTNREMTECACTHMGNSLVVLMVPQPEPAVVLYKALVIIACMLSIVCLAFSLFALTFFRSFHNVRNTIHCNLCFTLLVDYLIVLIRLSRIENRACCIIMAMLCRYLDMVLFCWMLMEGYQLYLSLVQVFESGKTRILPYYLFSYGFPAVVIGVTASVAWDGSKTDQNCSMDLPSQASLILMAPAYIIILANLIILVIALRVILSANSLDRGRIDKLFGWLKGSATMLCLLGFTHLFCLFAALGNVALGNALWVVNAWIIAVKGLQGVFIFIVLVVLNEKVRSTVIRWLKSEVCCLCDKTRANNSRIVKDSRSLPLRGRSAGLGRFAASYIIRSTLYCANIKKKQLSYCTRKPLLASSSSAATTTYTGMEMGPLSPQLPRDMKPAEGTSSSNSCTRGTQPDTLGGPVKNQLDRTAEVPT